MHCCDRSAWDLVEDGATVDAFGSLKPSEVKTCGEPATAFFMETVLGAIRNEPRMRFYARCPRHLVDIGRRLGGVPDSRTI